MNEDQRSETAEGRRAVDRRTMLKAAVAAGTIAGTWVAPRIETLGFAPAAASHTPCVVTSSACDDLNSNNAEGPFCAPGFDDECCGKGSFGDSGAANPDRITINFPAGNPCSKVVVRTIAPNCAAGELNPDLGAFAVVIDNSAGQTDPDCNCVVKQVLIFSPGTGGGPCTRGPLLATFNNVDHEFDEPCGPGVLVTASEGTAQMDPPDTWCDDLPNNSRLAVVVECTGIVACPPAGGGS